MFADEKNNIVKEISVSIDWLHEARLYDVVCQFMRNSVALYHAHAYHAFGQMETFTTFCTKNAVTTLRRYAGTLQYQTQMFYHKQHVLPMFSTFHS